ncbi:MAG: hypothetical protein IPJ81_08320 [Chitinophagaceae bacterium]|nr:hypothetical protein [Chitinophagaceae bacterium]
MPYSNIPVAYEKDRRTVIISHIQAALLLLCKKLAVLCDKKKEAMHSWVQSRIKQDGKVERDTAFVKIFNSCKRVEIRFSDSVKAKPRVVEWYNPDSINVVYKAILQVPQSKIYFYHYNQNIFDSLRINKKNIQKLIDEKTNVFTLYQNWLLWQLYQADSMYTMLYEYAAGKNQSAHKQKEQVKKYLAVYNGNIDQLTQTLVNNQKNISTKLFTLTGTDYHYYEQLMKYRMENELKYATRWQYKEGLGLSYQYMGVQTAGNTYYQATDHRGNVMAVVTDKKIQHDDNKDGIVDYYTADVVKATDYSSFGAPLPGRTYEIAEYKYEYNGKETDKETGYQDYGMRMYDPNLARFISVDPITKEYPHYTPYSYAGNKPIKFIDLDGAEETKNWGDYNFTDLMNWASKPTNPLTNSFLKMKVLAYSLGSGINRNFNPIYYGWVLTTGNDPSSADYGKMGRVDAAANLTTMIILHKSNCY